MVRKLLALIKYIFRLSRMTGQQADYSHHGYLSNYPHSHHTSAFRSHASAPYSGSYGMKNDLDSFPYPEQPFAPDPYSYPTYMSQTGGYPTSTVSLSSAGTSGSAFNVVQSAASSFSTHHSYQSSGTVQGPFLDCSLAK